MAALQKNVAGQNFTFGLINLTNGSPLTGASVSVYVTKDGGAQASGGGAITETGNGQYNYAPTQAETNATDVGFKLVASNAISVNIDFHTDPAYITSNVKKNAAGRISFTMTNSTTHAPQTGLTVISQVSLDGGAFGATANSVSEVAYGNYTLVLTAADTNGNDIMFRFTAAGADDLNIEFVTQP
jgi:hypothetical protein